MIRSHLLQKIFHTQHFFATRQGGVSEGRYASLNCGPGSEDNPAHVKENRARILMMLEMPKAKLLSCYQVHGNDVLHVTKAWGEERPKADAMVTDRSGLALGILTADCAPLLFADEEKQIIGAAHAGWRGALAGIGLNVIKKMRGLGAKHIKAAIGPTIAAHSYEVSTAFKDPFLALHASNAQYFHPAAKPGHLFFDLPGFLIGQLRDECEIEMIERDTLTEEDWFFSNRRTYLNGGGDYGRQISVIALKGK